MGLTKLGIYNVLRQVKVLGKWFEKRFHEELINQLNYVVDRFGATQVRYVDNIHLLYDVLKAANLSFEEDLDWLYTRSLKIKTKTSGDAYRLLDAIMNDRRSVDTDTYFRQMEVNSPYPMKDWYSNKFTFMGFYELGVVLLGIYCDVYPKSEKIVDGKTGSVFDHEFLKHNPGLQRLLTGKTFKLIVSDLIEITRLISRSNTRDRYEKNP